MTRRTPIRWPTYTSVWAVIAGLAGVHLHDRLLIAAAALMVLACWGVWLTEDPR